MTMVRDHAIAGGAVNLAEPRWTSWMAVAIEQQKEIGELREIVDRLAKRT